MAEKSYREAAALFALLLAEDPGNLEYARALGLAYASAKEYELAVDPLRQACLGQRDFQGVCFQLGRVYYYLDRYEQALEAYRLAETQKPSAALLSARAQALEALERGNEASELYRLALQEADSAEERAQIHLRHGKLEYRRADIRAAASHFSQATRLAPSWGLAWKELARAQQQLNQPAEAALALEKAIANGERTADALTLLGRLYLRMQKPKQAEALFEEARQMGNGPPE